MTRILVTGAAGFIGSSLIDELLLSDDNIVVGVDNLLTGKISNLHSINNPRFSFVKADVNNIQDLMPLMCSNSFDYVFHYAAVVGVRRTLDNPLRVLDDITGLKNILMLSKNTGVKRFFFSSCSEVYGEPVEMPQNETTTPLNSRLPYAIVKNVGEAFVKSYFDEHSLDFTILRFFNTYGSRQSTDFVLSKFINSALKNEPLTVYGAGSQTRSFCYINDNIELTLNCLYNHCAINKVINVGSHVEISILELAKLVIRITNSNSNIIHLPPLKDGDMLRRCPDNTLMKEILQRPLTDINVGIECVVNKLCIN